MIYYIYKIEFTNANGNPVSISQARSCEDADYDVSLEETKLIVSQQAWANNDFALVSDYTESTSNISASQYNIIVTDPSEIVPIDNWDPTQPLNNEPNL
jgi:hypothetical protein